MPETHSDAARFVDDLMATLPRTSKSSVAADQIPSVVAKLDGARDATWVVFAFAPPDTPSGQDAVNLQYCIEDGAVGLEWVLLSARNVADESAIKAFITRKGFCVVDREKNNVRYLRVEGPGIEQLGIDIVNEVYGVPPTSVLSVITAGFDWEAPAISRGGDSAPGLSEPPDEWAGSRISRRVDQMQARASLKGRRPRLTTGLQGLDRVMPGAEAGDLLIVAGGPHAGKTSFGIALAQHAAIGERRPVAMFCLNDSGTQIAARLLSSLARVPLQRLQSGELTDADHDRIASADGLIRPAPLFVDDAPGTTLPELRSRARRLAARHSIELLIIDCIELISGTGDEGADLAEGLKNMARELQIPLVALSRVDEAISNKQCSRLTYLRHSGSLIQAADYVLFIDREEVRNPATDDKGAAEITIVKQPLGPRATVTVSFNTECAAFR